MATGKLAMILNEMLTEAKRQPKSRRTLARGLGVVMEVQQTQVRVTLWRMGEYPSLQEWDTIMRHFPYDTPRIVPETRAFGDIYTLAGVVPSEGIMQGRF